MKVEATQSDFDELCNTLFLNGMIEVADDEPVYRQAQSCSNNWGGSSRGCVSPFPRVRGHTLVFDARAVNDLFIPFPIEVDPVACSSRRASFEHDGGLVVQWNLCNLAFMVALPKPWRKR